MRNTIKNHNDFITDRNFPFSAGELFTVRTRPTRDISDPRYGLVVSKRNFRFAVSRNRAKRLLRDWIRFADEYMCSDLDYVFFAHPRILDADITRDMGRGEMVRALNEIKHRYEIPKK